jgi:hypothetical protein
MSLVRDVTASRILCYSCGRSFGSFGTKIHPSYSYTSRSHPRVGMVTWVVRNTQCHFFRFQVTSIAETVCYQKFFCLSKNASKSTALLGCEIRGTFLKMWHNHSVNKTRWLTNWCSLWDFKRKRRRRARSLNLRLHPLVKFIWLLWDVFVTSFAASYIIREGPQIVNMHSSERPCDGCKLRCFAVGTFYNAHKTHRFCLLKLHNKKYPFPVPKPFPQNMIPWRTGDTLMIISGVDSVKP